MDLMKKIKEAYGKQILVDTVVINVKFERILFPTLKHFLLEKFLTSKSMYS
mgnify:CR=1 FL=1